jgi:hypothetical protein
MERRQRRSFTEEYRRQAVELVASSGRSIGSVANELGLRDSVLHRWVERVSSLEGAIWSSGSAVWRIFSTLRCVTRESSDKFCNTPINRMDTQCCKRRANDWLEPR